MNSPSLPLNKHCQGGTQFRKTKERLLNSGEELDKKALHTVIKYICWHISRSTLETLQNQRNSEEVADESPFSSIKRARVEHGSSESIPSTATTYLLHREICGVLKSGALLPRIEKSLDKNSSIHEGLLEYILLPIQMVIEDVAHNKLGATAEETAKNSSFLEAILDSSMEFTWSYLWGHDSVIGNMSISLLGRYAATKILSRHHCSKSQALLVLVLSSSGGYPRSIEPIKSSLSLLIDQKERHDVAAVVKTVLKALLYMLPYSVRRNSLSNIVAMTNTLAFHHAVGVRFWLVRLFRATLKASCSSKTTSIIQYLQDLLLVENSNISCVHVLEELAEEVKDHLSGKVLTVTQVTKTFEQATILLGYKKICQRTVPIILGNCSDYKIRLNLLRGLSSLNPTKPRDSVEILKCLAASDRCECSAKCTSFIVSEVSRRYKLLMNHHWSESPNDITATVIDLMGDKLKQTNSQIGNDALHFINRQIITVVLEDGSHDNLVRLGSHICRAMANFSSNGCSNKMTETFSKLLLGRDSNDERERLLHTTALLSRIHEHVGEQVFDTLRLTEHKLVELMVDVDEVEGLQ